MITHHGSSIQFIQCLPGLLVAKQLPCQDQRPSDYQLDLVDLARLSSLHFTGAACALGYRLERERVNTWNAELQRSEFGGQAQKEEVAIVSSKQIISKKCSRLFLCRSWQMCQGNGCRHTFLDTTFRTFKSNKYGKQETEKDPKLG